MDKIFCNTRVMNANMTGVQRYTKNILEHFPQDKYSTVSPEEKCSRGVKGHVWDQILLPTKIKNHLLWSPNNTGPMYYKRQVLTLHDLVHVDHPDTLSRLYTNWYNYFLPILCKNAAHIITISEFSRSRIIEHFKIPESKITVIYNGVKQGIKYENSKSNYKLPFKRYVLSLGSIEPRKNISTLISAWKNIFKKLPDDIGLVIVGGKGNSDIFKSSLHDTDVERIFYTGHLSDDHVNQLYADALVFVYLSYYEGFGLPPLEAMSYGIPVVTGNRTSLPEVVGDAGIMVDPLSVTECSSAIIELINNKDKREDFRLKGVDRASKFTWEDSSRKTWTILQKF